MKSTTREDGEPEAFAALPGAVRVIIGPKQMSLGQVRSALQYWQNLNEYHKERLHLEVAACNVDAVREFDQKNATLTRWLIGLTVALVLLTAVI